MMPAKDTVRANLEAKAKALGFEAFGIASADTPALTGERLRDFIALDRHGTMEWLAETAERRVSPQSLWPDARSAIVLGMNYGPERDPMESLALREAGTISVYARHRDYHDVVKGKLKELAATVAKLTGADVKVFVDTAPLMEKPLAALAGLGWQGKHTNLVSRDFGSWLFLGVILTAAELAPDEPAADSCGTCRACLDICPTNAFPAPYQLDARRCISYLTIEHAGHIARELRPLMGNRIFGCDDCLAVCPWNKFASLGAEAKLAARGDLAAPRLEMLAGLDDAAFRRLFSGSPIKRIGRDRFVRNVLIAIGNSGSPSLAPAAEKLLADPPPLVRAMAVWALARLLPASAFRALRDERASAEADGDVLAEWRYEPS
jgi:epoxyqueuosine reductase